MTRISGMVGGLAAIWVVAGDTPATAEVLDAVYRGTMLCDRAPFIKANRREALEVNIDEGKVRYTHVVRLRDTPELKPEQGSGAIKVQDLTLEGGWDGGAIHENVTLHTPGPNATLTIASNGTNFPQSMQALGAINFEGHGGAGLAVGAVVQVQAATAWSAADRSTQINIIVVNGTQQNTAVRFGRTGSLGVGNRPPPTQAGHIDCAGILIGGLPLADWIRDNV